MKPRLFLWLVAAIVIMGLVSSPIFAQTAGAKPDAAKAAKATKKTTDTQAAPKAATKKATAEPQKPPQPGMVWANEKSKIYHKEGDAVYGKGGKNFKWMTEDAAKKEGFRESKATAAKPATAKKTTKKAG